MIRQLFLIGMACGLAVACSKSNGTPEENSMSKENIDGEKLILAVKEKSTPAEALPAGDKSQSTEFDDVDKLAVVNRNSKGNSLFGENWSRNLKAAQAKAGKENRLVFLYFTGSDWCPDCKALHSNVLTEKPFLDFAEEQLELVVLDFPRSSKLEEAQRIHNDELSSKYNVTGFPTVIVMDADGKPLFRESGFGGNQASVYVQVLKKKLGR